MTDLCACVIGTLTTHGFLPDSVGSHGQEGRRLVFHAGPSSPASFLPHPRTQEEPGGVLAPTTEPARLTDTSGSREIAQHIEAQKRKDARHGN